MTDGQQHQALVTAITDATREGRVQDWVERIAVIARKADAPMDRIVWAESPHSVAWKLVEQMKARGTLPRLIAAVAEYPPGVIGVDP